MVLDLPGVTDTQYAIARSMLGDSLQPEMLLHVADFGGWLARHGNLAVPKRWERSSSPPPPGRHSRPLGSRQRSR